MMASIIEKEPSFDKSLKLSRMHTRISSDVKLQWEKFLLLKHGTTRGVCGPEIERALEYYMKMNSLIESKPEPVKTKPRKNTLETLNKISARFKKTPSFPIIIPMVIQAIIRDNIPQKDKRTILKYNKEVLKHSMQVQMGDEIFPQCDVSKFCGYVDDLLRK